MSAPSCGNGQGFLTLASDPRVKPILRNIPIERFDGDGWVEHHVSTTLKVDQGDIVLIRRVGIGFCPGLKSQMSTMKSIGNTSTPSSSARMITPPASSIPAGSTCSSPVHPPPSGSRSFPNAGFTGSKRKRDVLAESMRDHRHRGKDTKVTYKEPISYVNLVSDSD